MTVLRTIFLGDGCERVSGATFALPARIGTAAMRERRVEQRHFGLPTLYCVPRPVFVRVSLGKADASEGKILGFLRGSPDLMPFCRASKSKIARLDERFCHQ